MPITVLAGVVLDGGGIAQVRLHALVAFCCGVTVLHFPRRGALSSVNLLLIRNGYILVGIMWFLSRTGFDIVED